MAACVHSREEVDSSAIRAAPISTSFFDSLFMIAQAIEALKKSCEMAEMNQARGGFKVRKMRMLEELDRLS